MIAAMVAVAQLVLLVCGCGLLTVAYALIVRRQGGRVHTNLFHVMLQAARKMGMGDVVILSEPRAPKGFVYVLEKQNLADSFHLWGRAVDAVMTRTVAERFFAVYADVVPYAYEMRITDRFNPRTHAVIKNLTDGGE